MLPSVNPMVATQTINRRAVERRPVTLAAKAAILDGSRVDCTVRNISAMGALIEFREPTRLPNTFRLAIPSAMFSADCEVRHQEGRMVGVMFVSNRMEALAAFG
jgi:PilZ domain